jgi:hypothetical protein
MAGGVPGWRNAADRAVAVAGEPVFWVLRPDCFAAPAPLPGDGMARDGMVLGPGLSLHHDGAAGSVRIAQGPDAGPDGRGLVIATEGFDGRYLSLAVALPEAAGEALSRLSILGLSARIGEGGEAACTVRLNLRAGPNLEHWLKPLARLPRGPLAEFDLARLPEGLAPEGGWFDLFIAPAAEGMVQVSDLVLWHRLRASL